MKHEETKIEKLKGVFEEMMEKSKISNKKIEIKEKKKRKRTITGDVDLRPQRQAMEKWLDSDREVLRKEKCQKVTNFVVKDRESVVGGPKSSSQKIFQDLVKKVTEKPTQFKDLKSLPDRHGLGEKKEKSKTGSEEIIIKVKVENNLESLPKKVQQMCGKYCAVLSN